MVYFIFYLNSEQMKYLPFVSRGVFLCMAQNNIFCISQHSNGVFYKHMYKNTIYKATTNNKQNSKEETEFVVCGSSRSNTQKKKTHKIYRITKQNSHSYYGKKNIIIEKMSQKFTI